MGPDLELREADIDITEGYTLDRLVSLVKRILYTPNVMQVLMTPQTVMVARMVAPTEEVLPPEDEADVVPPLEAFLAKPIEALESKPGATPIAKLQEACDLLLSKGCRPSFIVAPVDYELFVNFFKYPEGFVPTHFMGIPVQFLLGSEYHAQLILFGGPTHLLDDIQAGISVSMEDT